MVAHANAACKNRRSKWLLLFVLRLTETVSSSSVGAWVSCAAAVAAAAVAAAAAAFEFCWRAATSMGPGEEAEVSEREEKQEK